MKGRSLVLSENHKLYELLIDLSFLSLEIFFGFPLAQVLVQLQALSFVESYWEYTLVA